MRGQSGVRAPAAVVAATALLAFSNIVSAAGAPVLADRDPCSGPPTGSGGVIVGSKGPDVLIGRNDFDIIEGRGGDDVICGLGFFDDISGGPGDDVIYGGDGGDLSLDGDGGDDTILGGGGGDDIYAGQGDDMIDGEHGGAIVHYDRARGPVIADLTQGFASTPRGTDTLVHVNGIWGSAQNDRIAGTEDADVLLGEAGNDRIAGLDGNDILIGADGKDRADGGRGRDRCSAERRQRCERGIPGL